jgi:hypothetical protein
VTTGAEPPTAATGTAAAGAAENGTRFNLNHMNLALIVAAVAVGVFTRRCLAQWLDIALDEQ